MSEKVTNELWHAGSTTGGLVRDCDKHGKVFFDFNEDAGDWEDGELEELLAKQEKNPEKYKSCDGVHSCYMFGREWVWDCDECQKELLGIQEFIWSNRHSIASFLNARLSKEAKRAATEKDNLSVPL